jgi:DNA-binding response OmpR family regulator
MLTAHSELEDKLTAFDCGADDYLVKPFALEELERRLHALTRRARAGFDTVLRVADLEFDTATLVVRRARTIVSLPATGRRLLEALMRNTHRVLSRVELERCLWGDETPQSNALKTHVHALREAIDRPFGSPLIHTVRGAGYRLCAPPDAHD